MKCTDARKVAFSASFPQKLDKRLSEAMMHIKDCAECSQFRDAEKLFTERIISSIKKIDADVSTPKDLRGKILDGTEKRDSKVRPYNKRLFSAVVSAAAVLILIVSFWMTALHKDTLITGVVTDHLQFLPIQDRQIVSSNREDVKRWLAGKLDFGVRLPKINAEIMGSRISYINGKQAALIFYQKGEKFISLFMIDTDKRLKYKKRLEIKGKDYFIDIENGHTILYWKDMGITCLFVSDISEKEMISIILSS